MNELVKAVRQVEHAYGSLMTAPKEELSKLQIFAKPFYRESHKRKTNSVERKSIILTALKEMELESLTAEEILDQLNLIPELTNDGEYPMPINNLYTFLKKYGFKYKRRRRGSAAHD